MERLKSPEEGHVSICFLNPALVGMDPPSKPDAPPHGAHAGCKKSVPAMDLQLLEHRVRVTSINKPSLALYTHSLVKFIFLPHRTRCKFFSITESPEDYTVMLDEEGFNELPPSEHLKVAEHTWRVLNVLANGFSSSAVPNVGVTKIAKSVIAPLAEHNVSVLMFSTYRTDYILIREDDLPVVFNTLSGELNIYKEDDGELVRINLGNDNEMKKDIVFSQTVHPVLSPKNKYCILAVDQDHFPSISSILLDVMFYSNSLKDNPPGSSPDVDSIHFFALSLIDGYISIVMDAETQKRSLKIVSLICSALTNTADSKYNVSPLECFFKMSNLLRFHFHMFPTDLLLTSSSEELWRMVRIGGQPLGFDECGIVAQIAGPLADLDISAYYISTFNFDHALVPEEDIDNVIQLLRERQNQQ
uniref:Cytosolic arginine sensor for mTORC1 subunit 1 n=1 Tax=Leptobrachium leishanense TaxID=445787 RepID=A0A8C5N1I7_9ANUR